MIRKRLNEECLDDDIEEECNDNAYVDNKIMSCEHIVNCKNNHRGIHNYRAIFELFILPRNRKTKVKKFLKINVIL